ncbi:MAG: hypothetical protein ABUL60_13790 [Myxococcales bacterium]
MKANNGLLVLGLFAIAGGVIVSCGGSDDSNDKGSAGSSASAGTTSKAGTTGTTAGTSSSSADTTNNGSGGRPSNNGGTSSNNGGTFGNIGGFPDFPGLGGAFEVPACPSGTMNGSACTAAQGAANACQLNETTYCGCQNDAWFCIDTSDFGGGGQGPTLGQATCPASPMTGDDCTGLGLCTTQDTCVCYMSTVTCR